MSAPRPSKDSEEVTETAAKSKVQSSNTEKDVSKQPSNGEAQRDALKDTSEPEGAANESMGKDKTCTYVATSWYVGVCMSMYSDVRLPDSRVCLIRSP